MIMVPALRPAMSPAMSNRASQTAINFDSLVSMLFAASEQGVWYDPSDMSTMYQDSAGTVPVTAVEQPVGRILDKSGRGNHATQATTTCRPTLSARYNLLTDTEAFAAWSTLLSSTTSNTTATTDPLGGNSADILVASASSGEHYVHQSANGVVGITYTLSVYAKAREYTVLRLGSGLISASAYFNLAAGTVISPSDGSASIKSIGDGWYQCYLTKPAVTSSTLWGSVIGPAVTNNAHYTGDGVSGIYLWGADLRPANDGVGLPPYQRVVDANTYDTAGFPLYLKFDGVDDSLQTASVDFSGTDKALVATAARKLSDAAIGCLVELSSWGGVSGALSIHAPRSASNNLSADLRDATSVAQYSIDGVASPSSFVLRAMFDISATGITNQIGVTANGATPSLSVSSAGPVVASALANAPIYIGRRAGTSLPFNGRLYSLLIRGAATPDATIATVERYLNSKARIY